ncbi:MAG: hypothetical protein U0936_02055 [Planctomycetaceae bacterium]
MSSLRDRKQLALAGTQLRKTQLWSIPSVEPGRIGGIIELSRLNAGDPQYGDMFEPETLSQRVVVGGTSLMGVKVECWGH